MTIGSLELLAQLTLTWTSLGAIGAGVVTPMIIMVGWRITAHRRYADSVQRKLETISTRTRDNGWAIARICAVQEQGEKRLERVEAKLDTLCTACARAGE